MNLFKIYKYINMETLLNIGEIRIILKSEDNFIDLKNAA